MSQVNESYTGLTKVLQSMRADLLADTSQASNKLGLTECVDEASASKQKLAEAVTTNACYKKSYDELNLSHRAEEYDKARMQKSAEDLHEAQHHHAECEKRLGDLQTQLQSFRQNAEASLKEAVCACITDFDMFGQRGSGCK